MSTLVRRSVARVAVTGWALAILAACEPQVPPLVSVREESGRREVRVASRFDFPRQRIDSVETVWRDARLGEPIGLAQFGDLLAVAESDRVHLLRAGGGHVRTIGRGGRGPGEFTEIVSIGWLDDQLIVYDVGTQRYSFFSARGDLIRTRQGRPLSTYVNPIRPSSPLRFWGSGVLRLAGEIVHTDRKGRVAVVWESLQQDSTSILGSWDDLQWTDAGGLLAPQSTFPSRARVAIGPDGTVAAGDGTEYCVALGTVVDQVVTRVCLDRARASVGPGVRSPDPSTIDASEAVRSAMTAMLTVQDVEEYLPSYDRLAFSEDGMLWVRAVGSDAPDVHPLLRRWSSEYASWRRTWEAFTLDGLPVVAVQFPASFEPRLFARGEAIGFRELPTGERLIGRVVWDLPSDVRRPAP